MRESKYLIVICSPNAVKSQYVNKEIIDFKSIHGEDRVLAIIVDGEPHPIKKDDSFNSNIEAFPKALKYRVGQDNNLTDIHIEPIAADAREIGDGKERAKIKLIAGMLGIGFDDLWRREKRRKKRRNIIIFSIILVLFIIISSLSIFSLLQWKEAEHQKIIALEGRRAAEKLVDHTLFDLRDKLEPMGKLKILRSTQEEVDIYYKQLGNMDLSLADKFRIATYHSDSGHYFEHIGKTQEAQEHYDAALKIMQQLVSSDPNDALKQRNLAVVHSDLGNLQIKSEKYVQAKENLLTALDIREKFLTSDKSNTQWWQYDLVGNYGSLGEIEEINGDYGKALGYLEKSIKIAKSLSNNNKNRSIQRRAFMSYFTMSKILCSQGKKTKSLNYAKAAYSTIKKLVQADILNTLYKRDLVNIDIYLGKLYLQANKLEKVIVYLDEAYDNATKLSKNDADDVLLQNDLRVSLNSLGALNLHLNKSEKAISYFKKSLKVMQNIRDSNRSNPQWDKEFHRDCTLIGWALITDNKPNEARVFINAAYDIEKTYAVISKLGHIAVMEKDYKKALELYEKSISFMRSTKDLTEGLFEEISELLETEWCDETCRNRLIDIKMKLIFGDNAKKINDLYWKSI